VASFIDRYAEKDDVVILSPDHTLKNIFNYYSERADLNKKPFKKGSMNIGEEGKSNLKPVVEGYNVVWLVTSCGVDSNGLKTLLQHMHYNMLYQIRFDGAGALPRWFVIELQAFRRQADE
jgi:hypothetical protein